MPRLSGPALYLIPTILAIIALIVLAGVVRGTPAMLTGGSSDSLRIATTTSLDDSGLLEEILPDFEDYYDVRTEVIAVGTGQALLLGERGDVDLVLVHAPDLEEEFVAEGYGIDRTTVMSNPFIIVGPESDPAKVREASDAGDALRRIAGSESPFVSRGDDSGTHARELQIWDTAEYTPGADDDWYHGAGQGMGETLLTANELIAYVVTDRATFVTIQDQPVAGLVSLYGAPGEPGEGDPLLENPYSAIAVNPETHPNTQIDLARDFLTWFNSETTRERIAEYGVDTYGAPLFTLIEES